MKLEDIEPIDFTKVPPEVEERWDRFAEILARGARRRERAG